MMDNVVATTSKNVNITITDPRIASHHPDIVLFRSVFRSVLMKFNFIEVTSH